jgi:DOPA 4,5-dioxygenase
MGRWREQPVGPHSKPMYQVAFTPELFGQVVPFLMLNRHGLDILIHPESGLGHAGDHAVRSAWLGDKLPLDIDFLERIDAGDLPA